MRCPCCEQPIKGKPNPKRLVAELPFNGLSRTILMTLAERFGRIMEEEKIIDSIYAFDPNGGPLNPKNVFSTTICRMRPQLEKYNLQIENVWGVGYRLTWRNLNNDA